jgi:hypothetical protein
MRDNLNKEEGRRPNEESGPNTLHRTRRMLIRSRWVKPYGWAYDSRKDGINIRKLLNQNRMEIPYRDTTAWGGQSGSNPVAPLFLVTPEQKAVSNGIQTDNLNKCLTRITTESKFAFL